MNSEWDKIAEWWDKKIGEEGDVFRRFLLNPYLFKLIGKNPQRILDVGCGNGYFARKLAKEGHKVLGIDNSPKMIFFAQKREKHKPTGAEFRIMDARNLKSLPRGFFDTVIANVVLESIDDIDSVFEGIKFVLKKEGNFIFSILHPCFITPDFYIPNLKPRRNLYFLSKPIYIKMGGAPEKIMFFHRPLQYYFSKLIRFRFNIQRMIEPPLTKKFLIELKRENPEEQVLNKGTYFIIIKSKNE